MLDAFLQLLAGQSTDRIVWTADITYWIAGQKQAGLARSEWDTEEGYLRLHRQLGIMPYYYYEKFWTGLPQFDSHVELVETSDGAKTTRVFRTPVGELVEQSVFSPVSCCLACAKHFVETERDLDVLHFLLEHRHLEPANLDDYPQRRRMWAAYDGLPCLGLPRSPLAALFCEWTGIQQGTYLIMDYPEKVGEVLAKMEEQERSVIEAVCESAPGLVHFPDNLSSENLTSFYDRYMAQSHRARIERLHEAGVRCAVHLDGTVRGLLPKLIAAGFDAVEAITPKPAGDLEIEEIDELAGDSAVILWGGVPGAMFAPPFAWPEMEWHIERLVDGWGKRRFVAGVADQVPPNGDIEFCRKVAERLKRQ